MAIKANSRAATILIRKNENRIGVMASFARVLDRVWPQVSLAIGLAFGVVCIAGLEYGFLRLVW